MSEFVKLKLGSGENQREYALMHMPPGKAVYFIPKATIALSPILLGEGDISSIVVNDDINSIVKLIIGGLSKIDPDQLTALGKEAISHECYAGPKKLDDPVHFDDWFTKHPEDMLQVMAWAIWENSKSFFPGGSELMDYLKSKVAGEESPSLKAGFQNTHSEES